MVEKLMAWAAERGYRIAWGPTSAVEGARREIEDRGSVLEIDESFFNRELKTAVSRAGDDPAQAVILIAKPRPAHRVGFDLDGRRFEALLTPTYFRYMALFEEVRQDLAENGLPTARVEHLTAPLKACSQPAWPCFIRAR